MVDRLVNSEANLRRIRGVEACFGSSGQPLVVPSRVLVGEGVLTKLCRKKPKPRQFFLFNDILVYGNIVINKKKYNKQHLIPLEQVKLLSLEDDGSLKNGWQIISTKKSFAVYAATATEKAEWMAHINKCIQDLFAKTGKKASDNHAAVWVPDSEASTCMHCMKSKFTALNRRHHCRKCGAVVCGACSAKRLSLPAQSSKPLRVCNTCYQAVMSKAKNPDSKKTDAVPAPSKELKGDEDSSGEENSDEEEAGGETAEVQPPSTPTFYQENPPSEQKPAEEEH
ncbi:pleckstrin homology domain-containing family F member 2-like [Actinia tenebrosa]|uniref:Pleckstrin homology domain-containing family F member 2-like n=1 Tax=Actinia tenebrosa TaxID=6105 RepID=A0A6P8ISZ8_ACTTE|nr:pleckstrin homology domain-containing family F member 2-like [Actinia tenebrosa]